MLTDSYDMVMSLTKSSVIAIKALFSCLMDGPFSVIVRDRLPKIVIATDCH